MRFVLVFALGFWLIGGAEARSAKEYLGGDFGFDPAVPTPESVLGYDVGDWHARPDQLVRYAELVAAASARVSLDITGFTHEQRPLVLLHITAPENQPKLESLRAQHLADSNKGPLVLYMGYSIHGNEPSGSNASLLYLYYLAASQDPWLEKALKDTVVLLDPSYNPDGLGRFATWVNSNKSKNLVSDRNNREQNEAWPRGRSNHYWFDLNRDWLLLQHPESQARIKQFHRWLPHLLTDHHEMGSDSSYFFQPGVATRQNPLTSKQNYELTKALGEYHADALDGIAQEYYSGEDYDDYYYGKGSTYPDINGSLGVLFEQASSRSHLADTINGPLSFQQTILNQLTTSLSSFKGAWALRDKFKSQQKDFFTKQEKRAKKMAHTGWIVGNDDDPVRMRAMLDIFAQHKIEFQVLAETLAVDGHEYRAGKAWFFPALQRQFGLLQAMMEVRTEFMDETFYDVSTWTFPHAFNLPYGTLKRSPKVRKTLTSVGPLSSPNAKAQAWAIPWHYASAPAVLQALLSEGVRVKVATKPFTALVAGEGKEFVAGTLLVSSSALSTDEKLALQERLSTLSQWHKIPVHNVDRGLMSKGIDLGSRDMRVLKPVKPLLLTESPARSGEAGEVWHLLDTRVGLAPTMVNSRQLAGIDLHSYTHLILVDGNYKSFSKKASAAIKAWLLSGGIVVAQKRAAIWAEALVFTETAENDASEDIDQETERRAYSDFAKDHARNVIGGAIVQAELDLSHPLSFGFQRRSLPLFRNGTSVLAGPKNSYASVAMYSKTPLLSGYIGDKRLAEFAGRDAVVADRVGRGLVVRLADNPAFRGYWYGSQRLLFNALYFGAVVDKSELEK